MSSTNLNRYIKEHLRKEPRTLSMSQMEELIEYDAWLDSQSGLTQRAQNLALPPAKDDTYKIEWLDSKTVRLTPSQ